MSQTSCEHFDGLKAVAEPSSTVCDHCVEMGDTWVHVRSCLICGAVGCCDNSVNRHARKHWEEHGHPLIKSIEPAEFWQYCFAHQVLQMTSPTPAVLTIDDEPLTRSKITKDQPAGRLP